MVNHASLLFFYSGEHLYKNLSYFFPESNTCTREFASNVFLSRDYYLKTEKRGGMSNNHCRTMTLGELLQRIARATCVISIKTYRFVQHVLDQVISHTPTFPKGPTVNSKTADAENKRGCVFTQNNERSQPNLACGFSSLGVWLSINAKHIGSEIDILSQ